MDERPPESPDGYAVLERAFCLMLVAMRGFAEGAVASGDPPPGGDFERLPAVVEEQGLAEQLTVAERRLLQAPLGSLTGSQCTLFLGIADAARTLLWALGEMDERGSHLLTAEQTFEPFDMIGALAGNLPAEWRLRDRRRIVEALIIEDVWLWRCRVAAAEREGNPPEGLRDRIREPLRYAEAAGFVELADDDLAIEGRPLSALSERDFRMVRRSAQMRSAALLWLLGLESDWERVNAVVWTREQRSGLEPPDTISPPPPAGPRSPRPTETAVAERVIALTTLMFRGQLEDPERGAAAPPAFEAWLRQPIVVGCLSPKESELIDRPRGGWTQQEAVDAQWRAEALGCLLWAISQLDEMPSFDTPFPLLDMLQRSGFLEQPLRLIAAATLRPHAELDRARSIAETWHWRDRTTQLARSGRPPLPGLPPVAEIIRMTAHAAHENGDIPPPLGDDFPALGKPYRLLSDDEHAFVGSIARERHYAFNWLCGYAPDWDSVRTDT